MKIRTLFMAHLEYVLLLSLVFLIINFLPENIFWDYIGKGAGILSIAILLYYIYKDKKERTRVNELTRFFSEEVDKIALSVKDSMKNLIANLDELSIELKKEIHSRHIKTFLNNERTSLEQSYEIILDYFELIKKKLNLTEAERLLLHYIYLKEKDETSLERFKNNLPKNGNLRKEFDLLLTAKFKFPMDNIFEIRRKAQDITSEELKKQQEEWMRRETIYTELKESLNKKELAMNSVLTVGKKLFSEGNIRETNLLSLTKFKKNIVVLNRKEIPLLQTIKKYQDTPPLTKVIEEEGFIKVFSRGDMYMKKDDSYDDDKKFKELIERIKKKTAKQWTALKEIPEGKSLKGVIEGDKYKLIVHRLAEKDFYVYNKDYPFTEEFNDKILSNIQPDDAIALIAEHPHKVKDILKRIDIDNLANEYSDEIQKIIFRRRKKIKNTIKRETGFEINTIVDFKKLKNKENEIISIMDQIIKDEKLNFSVTEEELSSLVNSMIKRSEEYDTLLEKLGIN